MSNQRAGKTHRAAMSDGMDEMKLRNFFRSAAKILEQSGQEDSAFYFEQITDHLNEGKSLPAAESEISRMLGV